MRAQLKTGMHPQRKALHTAVGLGLAMLLTGCGGGGGGAVQTGNNPLSSDFQGIWSSKSAGTSTSTIVLPDLRLWTVINEGSTVRLITAKLSAVGTNISGNGTSYIVGTSGSVTSNITLSQNYANTITVDITTGTQKSSRLETYQSKYETPVSLADFAKSWSAMVGVGKFNWAVTTTGAITGRSTTGCTYTGQLTERAERKAVVEASITETCADAVTKLQGISTLNTDRSQWNVVATTSDENNALVLSLSVVP